MSGLTNTESLFTYVNTFQGKFTVRTKEDDHNPEKRERVTSEGNKIWEIPYGKLEDVYLADIREATHEQYGASWEFIFMADNKYYLLRIGKNSPISSMILNRLENIDLKKIVTLSAWQPKGEDKTIITLWQEGKQIERVYTKENPGALPPPEQKEINGKPVWDWTEQLVYWSELVKSLKPHMQGVHAEAAQVAQEQATVKPPEMTGGGPAHGTTTPPATQEEADDLPF